MLLGSIKAPVPSSRPGIALVAARGPCQIRRLRRDRSHAQPPLLGASRARTHDLPRPVRGATLGQDVVALRSVTAVAKRWLHRGDAAQIEIDHLLKSRRRGAVAQAFGQGLAPRGALGLDREHLGQRVVPALHPAAPWRAGLFDVDRRPRRLPPDAVASLAFGVGQRGLAFGYTATGHGCSPLRNDEPRGQPATLKRSSYRIANWFIASFQ